MMADIEADDGPGAIAEHLTTCHPVQAAIVVEGSADETVAVLIAAGWTLEDGADLVAGKRIRYLNPPAEEVAP